MSSLMRIKDIMAVSSDPIRINLIEWCPIFLGMRTLRGKMTFFSGECALDRFTKTFFWNFQKKRAVLCYILIDKQMLH